jgi:hypothetical protein
MYAVDEGSTTLVFVRSSEAPRYAIDSAIG